MDKASFSIKEALGFGWAMTKERFGFLFSILLISLFFSTIPDIVDGLTDNGSIVMLFEILSFVLGFVIDAGLIFAMLRLYDGKPVKVSDIFSQYPITFQYFIISLLHLAAVILGSILLIIPGIYLGLRLQFGTYFLIDRRTDIVSSLKESFRITDGHAWHLFRFFLALVGINLLGFLALGVGLLFSIPTSMLATAFVYRKLSSPVAENEDVSTEESSVLPASVEENDASADFKQA